MCAFTWLSVGVQRQIVDVVRVAVAIRWYGSMLWFGKYSLFQTQVRFTRNQYDWVLTFWTFSCSRSAGWGIRSMHFRTQGPFSNMKTQKLVAEIFKLRTGHHAVPMFIHLGCLYLFHYNDSCVHLHSRNLMYGTAKKADQNKPDVWVPVWNTPSSPGYRSLWGSVALCQSPYHLAW